MSILMVLAIIAMWCGAINPIQSKVPFFNFMVLSFALLLTDHFFPFIIH